MNQRRSIDEIKKGHDRLYEQALRRGQKLLAKSETGESSLIDPFRNEVNGLLENIHDLSAETRSFDDYRWLTDAAIKWQFIFSALLNIPKNIHIPPASEQLHFPPPPLQTFSEEELKRWVEQKSFSLSRDRRVRDILMQLDRILPESDAKSKNMDWRNAEVILASEVLDGKINFAGRIGSTSYWRLENIWLAEVKRLRAYLHWENRRDGFDSVDHLSDYYQACQYIREMLVDAGIKASPTEFAGVKAYLEDLYLNDGKIDRDNKPATNILISTKASQIWESTGITDHVSNWIDAETYTRMFYESIIPAVMEDDRESVLTVLKAFQSSETFGNCHHLINCFETALAIYFLNAEVIQQLWDEAAKELPQESCVESLVNVQSWPKEFEVPDECKENFWFDSGRIAFKGVMSELQKQTLLNRVKKDKHVAAVEALFAKSRLIRQETTL